MARKPAASPSAIKSRAAKTASVLAPAGASAAALADKPAKKPFNPMAFFNEVRAESRKITWTTWKETWITSLMVAIMVVLTAVFFMLVDWGLGLAVAQFLKFANAG